MVQSREYAYKLTLLVSDAVALTLAFFAALHLRYSWLADLFTKKESPDVFANYLHLMPLVVGSWLVILKMCGCYGAKLRGFEEAVALFKGTLYGAMFLLVLHALARGFPFSRAALVFFVPLAFGFGKLMRTATRRVRSRLFARTENYTRLAVLADGGLGEKLAREIRARDIGYELRGLIAGQDLPADARAVLAMRNPVLGDERDVERLIEEHALGEVWVALTGAGRDRIKAVVDACLRQRISFKVVPDVYELMLDWVKLDSLGGIPLIGMRRSNITGLNVAVKRAMDLAIASACLLIFALPMLAIALLIKLTSRGPVFFLQKRIGQDGCKFVFLKFRSMYPKTKRAAHKAFTDSWITGGSAPAATDSTAPAGGTATEAKVYKIVQDPRVTPIGRFIRKYSLDELPQFLNVLRGDMSVIGPRPGLAYELEKYSDWHRRRLEVRPGISGLWQVSGRNLLSFDEMVKLDIHYIENWSFLLDVKILFKTVWVMFFGKAF